MIRIATRIPLLAACVLWMGGTACHADTHSSSGPTFQSPFVVDWDSVNSHIDGHRATLCVQMGDFVGNVLEMSAAEAREDLGVRTFSEFLDLIDQIFEFIDKHCGPGEER